MDALSETQREIAAHLFKFLVTPSRSKIAQAVGDLVAFGEAPEADVMAVLSTLTDNPDSRILRRLSSPERYELFHDVLAQPILDWRRGFLEAKKRLAEQQEQEAEMARNRREVRRLRAFAAAMFVVSLLAILAALYGYREKRTADAAANAAQRSDLRAQVAEREAQARASDAEAARARADGQESRARELDAQATSFKQQAADLKTKADGASGSVSSLQGRLDAANVSLQKEKIRGDGAESQGRALQTQLDQANTSIASLKDQLDQAGKSIASLQARLDSSQTPSQPPPASRAPQEAVSTPPNADLDGLRKQVTLTASMQKPNRGNDGAQVSEGYVQVFSDITNSSKVALHVKGVAIQFADGHTVSSLASNAPEIANVRFASKLSLSFYIAHENGRKFDKTSVHISYFARRDITNPKSAVAVIVTFTTEDGKQDFDLRAVPTISPDLIK